MEAEQRPLRRTSNFIQNSKDAKTAESSAAIKRAIDLAGKRCGACILSPIAAVHGDQISSKARCCSSKSALAAWKDFTY